MKPATLKVFTALHTWTGLVAGMALFIAFYAGAMTVFTHELDIWDNYLASPQEQQTYIDAQLLVDKALIEKPAAGTETILRLELASPGHPENVVRWFERLDNGEFTRHEFRLEDSGKLNTEPNNANLADFIYLLHYTAGLPSSFGLEIMGIICLIYGLALVSGVIIFIPNFLKNLFIIRPGNNKKRFWLDTHNVVGIFSLPWHIMYAWSSVLLAIAIYVLAPFQLLIFDSDLIELIGPELGAVETIEPAGQLSSTLSVTELVAIAKQQAPGISVTQIRYTHVGDINGTATIRAAANAGTVDTAASITINSHSGEILTVAHPAKATLGSTFYRGLLALHFANFGGDIIRWVYFILGLAGAFLFYSGNLLWIETRRKRRVKEQAASTVFFARLNSGVCIGAMAGVSASFIASRGFAALTNRGDLTELAYYLVFFVSIIWCFVRPVTAGTRDLLYLCAALTLGIVIADAIAIDMPLWRSAIEEKWIMFVIQTMTIIGAIVFFLAARAVNRRALKGKPHSVWAHSGS
jgi:uncharacterized iron-regulated membrane protein